MNTRDEVRQMRIREWKKVFEDKASSGLSAKEYCQQNGIGKDQYFLLAEDCKRICPE